MISWVFDVDGVLCPRNGVMCNDFKAQFLNWAHGKDIFFVTGSNREKTIHQLGIEVVNTAKIVFNCMGNSVWANGIHFTKNNFQLTSNELNWISSFVTSSNSPVKSTNNIIVRQGSINFSVVGQGATIDDRQKYMQWDSIVNERANFIKQFTAIFPRFEAYIGGDVSIDICLRGANKGQCLRAIRDANPNNELHIFVDRCGEFGIDVPLTTNLTPNDKLHIIEHYTDTLKYL
jgi:phosphomannomutase